ncbi:MAG TPA: right-handed parallel beta-helix repeat-containing protein [Nannocystaceae bacterium]|nr:right-handed parallel beta-helix repeat-containing protein [Nannocystaceae bacterium]
MHRSTSPKAAPTLAIAGCITLAIPSLAAAAELRVDDDAAPGGDGSPASPFASVQAAIDAAGDGDDILVAGGTYDAFTVNGKTVNLFGSWDADFAAQTSMTASIVMGSADGPAVSLFEVGDTVLDSFTIRGGQRGLMIDADYLSTTNRPTISNNVIEQNGDPTQVGGGVLADHCDATFEGNTIRDNVGDRGAGMATACNSIVIEDNVVSGNVGSGDHGGGLYLTGPMITLRGNTLRGNEIGVIAGYGWGAGAIVYGMGVTATFERNVFTENHAQSLGSGAFVDDGAVATFTGDLFYANVCGDAGGASVYVDGYDTTPSRATLTNVTFAAHACPEGTAGNAVTAETTSIVEVVDSIAWGNGGDDFNAIDTSMITARYTLSEEPIEGEGNLSADPLFADPGNADFHVRSTKGRWANGEWVMDDVDSPTIDAGDPAADFANEPGPNGLRVNMGHTGNTAQASMGGPGGDPPMGDESGGSDDGEMSGTDVGTDDGGDVDSGSADGSGEASDGGTDDGAPADEDMTVSCACATTDATPPWIGVLALVCGAALFRALRRLRPV